MRRRTGTLVKRGSKYYVRWKVADCVITTPRITRSPADFYVPAELLTKQA